MSWHHWVTAALFLIAAVSFAAAYWRTKKWLFLVPMLCFLVVGGIWANRALQKSRPQVEVKNVGTTTVVLRHDSGDLTLGPEATGFFRYFPGDSLTIFAGETDAGKSKTVTLPPPEPGPLRDQWAWPRVPAEVNADNPDQIDFRCPK